MNEPVRIGSATLITADVLEGLRSLPADSVHCVVTSPPYWGLRDYGVPGMIGLEPTLDEWLSRMVEVGREIRRVLRPDGTFWLNCGDAYANSTSGGDKVFGNPEFNKNRPSRAATKTGTKTLSGFKPKDLLMMPARLAIALQSDGWWLRSEIIWSKPNPMPESVTDRPTSAHEKIYLLTRSARYFYDADAVREQHDIRRAESFNNPAREREGFNIQRSGGDGMGYNPAGRNLRNVWTIATQPYPEAHFATFPEALPMKCIMAGTSERGCCPECGAPWERVVEKPQPPIEMRNRGEETKMSFKPTQLEGGQKLQDWYDANPAKTTGWKPTCSCEAGDPIPCTVLDCFSGSATTGLVALKLGRRYIGIELNPEYQELALKRIAKEATQGKLFNQANGRGS